MLVQPRAVVWFSCGAASAVAAKLATQHYGGGQLHVVYCDTMESEHPDNARFLLDVQRWIGQEIKIIKSTRYQNVDDVFTKKRYMSGEYGAPCTVEMKKRPRFEFQKPTDIHIFGMTSDERKRIGRFTESNPELRLRWILLESGLSKDDCLAILRGYGIEIPQMYKLGYRNNNCMGCVKASSPSYWNKIRRDFPEVFHKRVEQSISTGAKLLNIKGERVCLSQLSPDNTDHIEEDLSCGPQCGVSAI